MRNAVDRFAINPANVSLPRSRFDLPHSVKLTGNVGSLVPFDCVEVYPGDSWQVKTSKVIRLQTLLTPVMDDLFADFYHFFVPMRLVWKHWKEFQGENSESAWLPQTTYSVPQIKAPNGGWDIGSVADYLGVPTGVNVTVNALPFRCYAKIIEDWFRDQNLQDPIAFSDGDATVTGVNTGVYQTDMSLGGLPFVANKYHDYFTSCLPSPQKGPDVEVPLGSFAPVVARSDTVWSSLGTVPSTVPAMSMVRSNFSGLQTAHNMVVDQMDSDGNSKVTYDTGVYTGTLDSPGLSPSNLWADLSHATAASINQLRMAFQIQRYYEALARGGSRYIEILKSLFGVTSPDASLQRSQYLGGSRFRVTVNQVIQQSETSYTPQGNVTGMSLTTDTNDDFIQSFTEHGYIISLMVLRYPHTYQQGLHKMWSRKSLFDFYVPTLANIGEQAVFRKELYCTGNAASDDTVFGYQEAWAELRTIPSRVAGEMRSAAPYSLDSWHFADNYNSTPYLSDSWIAEDPINVDRTLAVQMISANQWFADLYVESTATRVLPMFSIPGMIDHF